VHLRDGHVLRLWRYITSSGPPGQADRVAVTERQRNGDYMTVTAEPLCRFGISRADSTRDSHRIHAGGLLL